MREETQLSFTRMHAKERERLCGGKKRRENKRRRMEKRGIFPS